MMNNTFTLSHDFAGLVESNYDTQYTLGNIIDMLVKHKLIINVPKPVIMSDELCEFIGVPSGSRMLRLDITKFIINYIYSNKLDDCCYNKLTNTFIECINPDEKLKALLKPDESEPLTKYNIHKYIVNHLHKYDEEIIEEINEDTSTGFVKPCLLSDEMCEFIGVPSGTKASRVVITRYISNYIADNNLKDESSGRRIIADDKLKNLLNYDENKEILSYFNLQRYLAVHFAKA